MTEHRLTVGEAAVELEISTDAVRIAVIGNQVKIKFCKSWRLFGVSYMETLTKE
jgi:hypothetical protein